MRAGSAVMSAERGLGGTYWRMRAGRCMETILGSRNLSEKRGLAESEDAYSDESGVDEEDEVNDSDISSEASLEEDDKDSDDSDSDDSSA